MTDPTESEPHRARPPSRRRPSLDDVFGDVLPDVTEDERPPESGASTPERWYEENRPPHHDQR